MLGGRGVTRAAQTGAARPGGPHTRPLGWVSRTAASKKKKKSRLSKRSLAKARLSFGIVQPSAVLRARSPAMWKKSHGGQWDRKRASPSGRAAKDQMHGRPPPPGAPQLEARRLAVNLSWKAIHLGQVPPRSGYGQLQMFLPQKRPG